MGDRESERTAFSRSTEALPASLTIPRAVIPSTSVPKQAKRYHRLHPRYQPPARISIRKPQLPAIPERPGVATLGYVRRAREDAVRVHIDLALPRRISSAMQDENMVKLEQAPGSEIHIVKRENTKFSSHGLLEDTLDTASQSSASSSRSAVASSSRLPLSRSRRNSIDEKSVKGEGRALEKQIDVDHSAEAFALPGPGTPGFLIEQILNETYEKWAAKSPFSPSLRE